MDETLEIVAKLGDQTEIVAPIITGNAEISATVETGDTELVCEVVAAGPRGPQGEQGPQGEEGAPGQDGADGADGVSPEVTVASITGGHSVTITDADHPGGQTFNVMDGADGQDGAAATIAVGTVSGLPAGSTPTVVNSGTSSAAVFDFGIPKGDKGDTGNTGPTGPGVPDGGAEATILRKHSGTDQDTEWYPPFIPYGQLDGTSTATVMTATIPGVTKLEDGVCIMLKNGVITSASGVTLNINGLGAKPIYSSMAATTAITTVFNVNYTMLFVYDTTRVAGGCWVVYYGYNANDNTIGYQLRTNSSGLPMSDKVYRYRICFTSADGTKWVPATTSTSTNATSARTVNQRPIDPFGKIIYYSYTTAIDAGSRLGTGYQWIQYALVLGYSFNVAGNETVTAWKPCYLKCAPQNDGSAIMDSTTPIVQALPSTEDGKIYIFLGVAYDTTHMELCHEHPVYYYKDSAIRLWTNAPSGGGGGSTDIFWATYGSTSVADIDAALAADQLPCVLKDDIVYIYAYAVDDKRYFASTGLNSLTYLYLINNNGSWSTSTAAMHGIPSGGNAGQVLKKNSSTDYDAVWADQTQVYPSAYCTTAAGTAAKKASCSLWADTANSYLHILVGAANTYAGAITLNVNGTGDKPVYINGAASSATNYSLPAGSYVVFYDGTNFQFRTDGKLPNVPEASSATPADLGTAAAGSGAAFARDDHVHNMPSNTDVGVDYKFYKSVADVGLTVGSATIAGAWGAMPDYSILICDALEFASGQCPSTAGTVEICRLADTPNARGWLYFRARRPGVDDYRMFLDTGTPGAPTGVWVQDGPYAAEYAPGTYTETAGTGYGIITSSAKNMYFYAFLPKFFHLASTVKVTALTATVRSPSGGYIPSSAFSFTAELSSANATIYGSHIGFHADRSAGWGQPNNSTTVFTIDSITFTVT